MLPSITVTSASQELFIQTPQLKPEEMSPPTSSFVTVGRVVSSKRHFKDKPSKYILIKH